jgi:hypothetical protein
MPDHGLAKVGSLRVISRTSAMRYKGTKKGLPQIARELNVDGMSKDLRGDRVNECELPRNSLMHPQINATTSSCVENNRRAPYRAA